MSHDIEIANSNTIMLETRYTKSKLNFTKILVKIVGYLEVIEVVKQNVVQSNVSIWQGAYILIEKIDKM